MKFLLLDADQIRQFINLFGHSILRKKSHAPDSKKEVCCCMVSIFHETSSVLERKQYVRNPIQIRVSFSAVGSGVLGATTGVGVYKGDPSPSRPSCGKTKLLDFGFTGSIDSLTESNSVERDRGTPLLCMRIDGAFVGVGANSRPTLSLVSSRSFFAGGSRIGEFNNGWLLGIGGDRPWDKGLATCAT